MKTLILYYSYGGNTRKAAQIIRERLGCDIAEIETIKAYPEEHKAVIRQAMDEIKSGILPEIAPLSVNVEDYDRVILGSPIWCYTIAPPVMSAISRCSWAGKTVLPFVTHGGDGAGDAFEKLSAACTGALTQPVLDVYFTYMTNEFPDASKKSLEAWAEQCRDSGRAV